MQTQQAGVSAGGRNELSEFFRASDSPLGRQDDSMPVAKGIFSVLNTDGAAAQTFNGAAYEQMIQTNNAYAQATAEGGPGAAYNTAPLQESDKLRRWSASASTTTSTPKT